jgi:Ca-activated chloride channel family protein
MAWSFASPWALLLLPLPVLPYFLLPSVRGGVTWLQLPDTVLARASTGDVLTTSRHLRFALLVPIWCLLSLALAGPQMLVNIETQPLTGRDLVLALDMSGSMENEDFVLNEKQVSRLEAVRQVATSFIAGRKGDRVGLIAFANKPYVAAPLTHDTSIVAQSISQITIGISGRSTSISDGLGLALKHLKGSQARSRVIVLLSDGIDTGGQVSPVDVGMLAARQGVKVYTIALGPIEAGAGAKSSDAVDTDTLRIIANSSGGQTFRVRTTGDLRNVTTAIDQLEPASLRAPPRQVHRSFWVWPASLAFLLLPALLAGIARRS